MRRQKNFLISISGLIFILGAILFIQGCCKTPLPPPPPPPVVEEEKDPTLEVFFPEEEIPYGEKYIVLSWTATNAKHVYVNDIRQPSTTSGTHTITTRVFDDFTTNFKAVNIKKENKKDVTVEVGDWTSSTFGMVSYYPWRLKRMSLSNMDDKVIEWWTPSEEERSWIEYYHRNGVRTVSNHPGATELWFIKDDSIIVINGFENRLQVSEEEMTISYQQEGFTWNGQDVWINLIFEHASTTPTDP